jgi:hypothetical protein
MHLLPAESQTIAFIMRNPNYIGEFVSIVDFWVVMR